VIDEDEFRADDGYIHYPYEDSKFRHDKATGKLYKRFYGHPEQEIAPTSAGYRAALSTGRLISRQEYLDEAGATEPVFTVVVDATAEPSAAAKELLDKSPQELESELLRLASNSRMPPSCVRKLLENADRAFLIHAIAAFRKPGMQLRPAEDLPAADLTKLALAVPLKDGAPAAQRRPEAVDELLKACERETIKPEDRGFHLRLALAAFIRENTIDPRILGRPMSLAFHLGDVYIDFPFEDAKFRYEKASGKVYARFTGRPENGIESSSNLYHDAISAGKLITREAYFRD